MEDTVEVSCECIKYRYVSPTPDMSIPSYVGGCRLMAVVSGVNASKPKLRTEASIVDGSTNAGKKHCGMSDKASAKHAKDKSVLHLDTDLLSTPTIYLGTVFEHTESAKNMSEEITYPDETYTMKVSRMTLSYRGLNMSGTPPEIHQGGDVHDEHKISPLRKRHREN